MSFKACAAKGFILKNSRIFPFGLRNKAIKFLNEICFSIFCNTSSTTLDTRLKAVFFVDICTIESYM